VGCVGIGKYASPTHELQHNRWQHFISRCYNVKQTAYENCSVCDEWHNFQNYCEWEIENYYCVGGERMDIDKDILVKGNREYGPNACVFVPTTINSMIASCTSRTAHLPLGVRKKKDTYSACMSKNGKFITIGTFPTPEEAFFAYKCEKEKQIRAMAESYKGKIPDKLYDALMRYEIEITD
jgi:hypothetical protein